MSRIFNDNFYQTKDENENEIKDYLDAIEEEFDGKNIKKETIQK